MIDLVHPRIDGIKARHSLGYMPGDGHPQSVGFSGYHRKILLFHGAVNFDLCETGIVVSVDPFASLFRSVDAGYAKSEWTGAIDDTCKEQSRPNAAAGVDGVAHGGDELKFVSAVPHRGNARGKIDWPPFHLSEMGMQCPKAWNE